MRIKMLTSQAGPSISRQPGKVYDLSDVGEARRLVESGQAEAVDELPPLEETPVEVAAADEVVADEDEPELEAEVDEDEEPAPKPTAKPKPSGKRRK